MDGKEFSEFSGSSELEPQGQKNICAELKDVFTWKTALRSWSEAWQGLTLQKGSFSWISLAPMSFSPGTLFCSPLSYRALSLGISSCSTATISFGKGKKGTAVSKTEPGQVWHQAQAVVNEWTMNPGDEKCLVPLIAQNFAAEESLMYHRELKNKC